jgi:hypothetical protein
MKSVQKKSWEAILAGVKNEMAIPQLAESARHTISSRIGGPTNP